MMKGKVLVAYYSVGGNTKITSHVIQDELTKQGQGFDILVLNKEDDYSIDIETYKHVYVGSPTYKKGKTPIEVLSFLRYLVKDNSFVLPSFSVFGTGDTQWGDQLYCRAVDEISYHLRKHTVVINKLKIEQCPVSNHQKNKLKNFVIESLGGLK